MRRAFGRIIYTIATIVDRYTSDITTLITLLAGIVISRDWIRLNQASGGHALALAALVFFVICPILYLVFTCLMFIPKILCHIGLLLYNALHEDDGEEYEEREWEREERVSQGGNTHAEALRYFGLSLPFSEAQLKEKYREAIKKAHPDAGGSTEEAEKVNLYYTELKGMCS